jgi:hypothetical protein
LNLGAIEITGIVIAGLIAKELIALGTRYFFGRATGDYRTVSDCDRLRDTCKVDRTNGSACMNEDLRSIKKALITVITYNENIPSDEKVELQQELFR